MPVYGKLDEVRKRFDSHKGVVAALDYLAGLGPEPLLGEVDGPALKVTLDGEEIFALCQSYHTKPEAEGRFEAHRKYIDVQYIVSGEELILTLPLADQTPSIPYDEAKDITFYPLDCGGGNPTSAPNPQPSRLLLTPGMVAALFPEDLHAPSLSVGEPTVVGKVVVKVRCQNVLSVEVCID